MEEVRATRSGASHLLLLKDDKILLLRRYNTGWNDGNYSVVAGHIEVGENASQAMIREAKEEANIDIEENNLTFAHVCHRIKEDGEEKIDFFFVCSEWSDELKNSEPHKCDHLDWFPLNELPDNMVKYVAEVINHWKNKINYSCIGW